MGGYWFRKTRGLLQGINEKLLHRKVQVSKGEIDFKLVLAQSPLVALTAFEKLYATGNPQGKSYALSGIRKLNPSKFKNLLESMRASTDQVEIERGCIISHEFLSEVAKQIDQGKFRF